MTRKLKDLTAAIWVKSGRPASPPHSAIQVEKVHVTGAWMFFDCKFDGGEIHTVRDIRDRSAAESTCTVIKDLLPASFEVVMEQEIVE